MVFFYKRLFSSLFFVSILVLCGCDKSEVIHDLSNADYQLVNQDSATVSFPSAYEGKYVVVGFIYTHCPDICNITTANLKNIANKMKDTANVQFLAITFDPQRDTPTVLDEYMQTFKLDEDRFTMLTGDSASVDSVLAAMDIQAAIAYRDTLESGEINYTMNHTDRIAVMDTRGRVRFEYPGSVVPPDYLIEDLNKLRSKWYEFF